MLDILSEHHQIEPLTQYFFLQILPELDRIEQDIELNYEELLIMESGLLLGGLSFYDQHRDMRLDIDNMSYEVCLLHLQTRLYVLRSSIFTFCLFISCE